MYSVTYFFPCRSLRQRANRMMDLVIYYMDIDLQSKLELAGGRPPTPPSIPNPSLWPFAVAEQLTNYFLLYYFLSIYSLLLIN